MRAPATSAPVESMFVSDSSSRGVRVYGEPMHMSESQLLADYSNMLLDDFLAYEARHGIGNYVLVDASNGQLRIITSPGYCGGYLKHDGGSVVAATTLSTLLNAIGDFSVDGFGLAFFLSPIKKSAFNQLPISTMFEGVHRLPPASIVEEGTIRSYIMDSAFLGPPASFEAAMSETCEALAGHYERTGREPTIMFSGGADSLVIYLALREHISDIRLLTIETMEGHSRGNGEDRAVPVAKSLGIPIEIVPNTLRSDEYQSALDAMLGADIVGTRAPHLSLAGKSLNTDILHGQNMDAIVSNNMAVLQANLERGYLSVKMIPPTGLHPAQQKTFMANMMFTAPYLTDRGFQALTAKYFSTLIPGTQPDPDPGRRGTFRGMLSSQYPNLIANGTHPVKIFKQVDYFDRELDLFEAFTGNVHPATMANLVRYYTYSHLANKRLAGLPLPDGSRVCLFAMSGPIIAHQIDKRRVLSDASRPKHQVYSLIQKLAGKPYSHLIKGPKNPVAPPDLSDPMIDKYRELIDPVNSRIIPRIADTRTRKHIELAYRQTFESCVPGAENFTLAAQSKARNIINLERILS